MQKLMQKVLINTKKKKNERKIQINAKILNKYYNVKFQKKVFYSCFRMPNFSSTKFEQKMIRKLTCCISNIDIYKKLDFTLKGNNKIY